MLAPHVKSAEEKADYSKMYNPESGEEFIQRSQHLDLKKLLVGLIGEVPEKIIVTEPVFFKKLDELVNPDTFQLMKSWMLVMTINALTAYLSEEFRQVGGTYSRALSGAPEARPQEKAAFYLASGQFDQVVGDYYGKKYFG